MLPSRVALLGFSAFERSALGSYFRLAAQRSPAYAQTESAADARFLIVDADQPEAVRTALGAGRAADAVFIGSEPPQGAVAWMTRPIDPMNVLRELDAMAGASAAPPVPAAAAAAAAADEGGGVWAPRRGGRNSAGVQRLQPGPGRRAGDGSTAAFVPPPTPAPSAPPAPVPRRALLVDDSEIALRYLESRLEPYGLETVRTANSGKAIELLSQQSFDFVFLDVELGPGSDFDGLALCHHIKRSRRPAPGAPDPWVTLVSAHHSELDRVRGMLAGADAYLGKPLDETQLHRMMELRGPAPVRHPGTGG